MIVGREEWCSFPSIGIHAIKARVDSGAKTSSIHAENIQEIKTDGILIIKLLEGTQGRGVVLAAPPRQQNP